MMHGIHTVAERLQALDSGAVTAQALLADALENAASEQGRLAHTQMFEHTARAEADSVDLLRSAGVPCGSLAGLPISIKDLFDVTGYVTRSGSRVLAERAPATTDAEAVRRLRAAGAVLTGHTNMTEFAYSGLGLNPHYGTPDNPLAAGRIPGGSSSGAGVATARQMATASLGTDTGGSVRIPAAFCGLVGLKPTQSRVPLDGTLPLSPTLDSIGPIAASVDCCARLDTVLSARRPQPLLPRPARSLCLALPTNHVLDGLDDHVAAVFERTVQQLSSAGALLRETTFPELDRLPELGRGGGITAAESYHLHLQWLDEHEQEYDPRVRQRIQAGADMSAADYLELHRRRKQLMAAMDRAMAGWDALVMPTVAVVPPTFSELQQDAEYTRLNKLVLRNPTVANLLGLCAITLPCHEPGELPVGLMLVGRALTDRKLLHIAAGVEALLQHRE